MRARTSSKKVGFEHVVEARLEELVIGGTMSYWVLFLPPRLQEQAPFDARKKLRMRGVVGGKPVSMAWQLSNRRHYVMFGRGAARSLGLALGQRVEMAFSIVSDDDVDVPAELREALRQEPAWRTAWKKLRPGQQRGLAHLVRSAKDPDVRAQRAIEILRSVEDGVVPGPPKRRRA